MGSRTSAPVHWRGQRLKWPGRRMSLKGVMCVAAAQYCNQQGGRKGIPPTEAHQDTYQR